MNYEIVESTSTVRIEGSSSVHPIHASSNGLAGTISLERSADGLKLGSSASGSLQVEVASLRASNPLVEAETKRRLNAKQFPFISGTITTATATSSTEIAVEGEITFRGETRAVKGSLEVTFDGDTAHITGSQSFDIRDWNFQPPKLLLLKVHPEITVHIDVTARPST